MKAILHTQYGAPDLLQLAEVDKPAPMDNEILIAVHATTVSTGDCNMRNFTFVTKSMLPLAKLMFGSREPWKARVLGTELAGEMESTGKDFTASANTYDLIFDIVGATSFRRCRHALKPRGIFLQNIMGLSGMIGILWTSMVGGKKVKGGVAMDSRARMNEIAELVLAGKPRPVVDRSYPLERIAEAFHYVEQGHKKGNAVITVAHP